MHIDPAVAVWIALALNLGGVLMMLGAKRQQMIDLIKRMEEAERCVDELDHQKLAVSDYHREQAQVRDRITELDSRTVRELSRIEGRIK